MDRNVGTGEHAFTKEAKVSLGSSVTECMSRKMMMKTGWTDRQEPDVMGVWIFLS